MDACFSTIRDGSGVVLVTASSISPVIPSSSGVSLRNTSSPGERRVLPLPRLAPGAAASAAVYGMAAVDCRGRVADRAVITSLGWTPGLRLSIREDGGLVLLIADPRGVFSLTRQGHVRLPVGVRRWCALAAGDRVLLVADPDRGSLVVFPPAALAALVRPACDAVFGGEAP